MINVPSTIKRNNWEAFVRPLFTKCSKTTTYVVEGPTIANRQLTSCQQLQLSPYIGLTIDCYLRDLTISLIHIYGNW